MMIIMTVTKEKTMKAKWRKKKEENGRV